MNAYQKYHQCIKCVPDNPKNTFQKPFNKHLLTCQQANKESS
jgi:hypothetical protein